MCKVNKKNDEDIRLDKRGKLLFWTMVVVTYVVTFGSAIYFRLTLSN